MDERVKIFTYRSGSGQTLIESTLEDNINEWLQQTGGEIVRVTQSESERQGTAHITICVWYLPDDDEP
ncbi:MAG: hypothetical protein ACREJB_07940 [Planctomycetaceae bacterium]